MRNLGKNQNLWQQWTAGPIALLWIVVLSLGAVLSPLLEAQALESELDPVLRADAPAIEGEEQGSANARLTPELNLPPLEQSLINVEPQGFNYGPEATAGATALEGTHQEAVTSQTSFASEATVLDFAVPMPEQSAAEDLQMQQTHHRAFQRLSQASPTPEQETIDSGDDATLKATPDLETTPEIEDSPDVEEAPDLETEEASETEERSEEREYKYGRNGQGRWFIQAGFAVPYNPDESNFYGLAGAGITHFFASGHSINVSLNGLAFSQEGSDSVGINLDVIARWHFLRKKTWSLFVDGGVGILNTTSRVPLIGGSRFNFTPQVGGGASLRIAKKTRLLMGIRWHHISNANLFEPNDGQDAVFGWVGLDLPR